MINPEEVVPNERLRHARLLKGWSQAELAEQVGTSFEMVSRWERGVTVPSPHYRKRLYAVLSKTAEQLGLVRGLSDPFTAPLSPLVLLASSHADAEKAIVSHLKTTLQGRGIALWNSRQFGRQGTENARTVLREVVRAAQVILIIISPEARSSRHVRDAFEMARLYQRPVCGVWIEGEHWERCLPEGHVELTALIDARQSDTPALLEEAAIALEHVGLASENGTEVAQSSLPEAATEAVPLANPSTEMYLSTHPSERPAELVPSQSQVAEVLPPPGRPLESTNTAMPMPPALPLPATLPIPGNRMSLSRIRVGLLIGLAILVIAGGILGSLSLLTHFGVIGARPGATSPIVARGGTWTYGLPADVDSLIPNGSSRISSSLVDQALYLPLFYGDAQGVIHAEAATEIPSVQNGGVNADATIWTFHMRPHLAWSDRQPYDARDVDFTWKLWANSKFGAASTLGLDLINSADVSVDHLSITFHLKRPFAPFLADLWVDGLLAPLPEHHFSAMAPETILKSPDNLNPKVTNGPFMMSGSVPGNHYTLVRNPRYYRVGEGLPYLDKVIFTIVDASPDGSSGGSSELDFLKVLQSGSLDANGFIILGQNPDDFQNYQRLKNYTIVYPPTLNGFEALYINFHNIVLASHLEVREAMAMAVDQQALIAGPLHGFGSLYAQ